MVEQPAIIYEPNVKINGDFIRGFSSEITQIEGISSPSPGIPFGLRFYFTKMDDSQIIQDLKVGDYIVASQTNVGSGVNAIGNSQIDIVGASTQFLDCVYKVSAVSYLGGIQGIVDVNVSTNVSSINEVGELGYLSFGAIGNVGRSTGSRNFPIPDPEYTDDMSNFPTLVRTKGGLRDRGGIAKRV